MVSKNNSGEELIGLVMVQTWVLKVSIHCEGCKKKVKKVLQKVDGVFTIDIDSKQNRVTVTGDVDADSLIRRLLKYGKHSELLPDKIHAAANSSSSSATASASANAEAKGGEKAATVLETEQKQLDEQDRPIVEAETPMEAAASSQVTISKRDSDAPMNRGGDTPMKSENDSEKSAVADVDSETKLKGKKVQIEESRKDEAAAVYDPVNIASPLPSNPFMERQPVYTMSFSTVHPSSSYAFYEAPPAMASSYAYPAYPPPSGYIPEHYSSESYYGSMEPPEPSSGSYDMFSEENPNACNLM